MGKRFDALQFPGHKNKVFTLSYDDAVVQDRRLVELFNRYGVKATFNVGYGALGFKGSKSYHGNPPVDVSKVEVNELVSLYQGHEIGGHSLDHPDLSKIGLPQAMYQIIEDKVQLEKICQRPLEMFAYPFGTFNDRIKDLVAMAGYKGARTTRSTHGFDLPADCYELDPTCHHNDPELMSLAKRFVEDDGFKPMMFYVWGHGYEFDDRHNWNVIEELLEYISKHKEKIWFATNGEILSYYQAYKRLEYSGDGSLIYNPSCIDIEICTYPGVYETLKAGQITKIKETGLL